jgi:adenylate cyclase
MLNIQEEKNNDMSSEQSERQARRPNAFWQIPQLRNYLPSRVPVGVKLAIAIGILLTIAMSLLGFLIVQDQSRLLNQQAQSTGRIVVGQMAESAKDPLLANDMLQLEVLAYNLASAENVLGTVIYSADYKVLARSGYNPFDINAPYQAEHKAYLNGVLQSLEWSWKRSPRGPLNAISFFSPVRFKDVTAGHVVITFSRETMDRAIQDAVFSTVMVTIILILMGILISYILGHRLTRPIQHLINASRAIGKGQFDYRIQERRDDEIGFLMNSFNSMAQGMLQKKQVEEAFTRHISPNIAKKILNNLEEVKLGGTHVFSSVLFVDMVGFTSKSESMDPEGVAELLNEFYCCITHSVHLYHGTIDKYIGDCAMVVFGVPEPDDDHVFHSIAYAVFLQKLADRINQVRLARNKHPVYFRIGVNAGEMIAGNMGSEAHMQYTVVGDSVNLASRLCSAAEKNQVMITEEIYNLPGISERIVAREYQSINVRGKAEPVSMYLVLDVKEPHRSGMEKSLEDVLTNIHGEHE